MEKISDLMKKKKKVTKQLFKVNHCSAVCVRDVDTRGGGGFAPPEQKKKVTTTYE